MAELTPVPRVSSRRSRPRARSAREDLAESLSLFEQQVARLFFGVCSATCAIGAVILAVMDLPLSSTSAAVVVAATAALSLLCAWVGWRLQRLELRRSVFVVGCAGIGLVLTVSYALGEGIHAAAMGFLALLCLCVVVICGIRAGVAATALALLGACGLLVAELTDLLGGVDAVPASPLWARAVTQVLILSAALAVGALIAGVVQRSVLQASQRGQRFRLLLDMAADWYWEQDAHYRFTQVEERRDGASGIAVAAQLGRAPWEIAGIGLNEAQMDVHRADLEARQAFSGLLARRLGADGSIRYVSISGEPRHDSLGRFAGFWGVGRDVTREVVAQRAMAASEARYRELFARSPSAVLLHRGGRVFDANEAAAALFGFATPASLIDLDIAEDLVPESQRAAVHLQWAELERLQPGEGVPVIELELRSNTGAAGIAEVTSVRVDTPTGVASMSIFFDITDRQAVQAALRRSEALLSSVISASPDAITLTDIATGRYRMVNDTFLTLTGYARDEVVGRTSFEIGLWADLQEREAVVAEVTARGRCGERVVRFTGKGGRRLQLMISAASFDLDGVRYLVTNSRDVSASERSRLEREAILDNASVGIAFTRGLRLEMVNRRFEQMLGWSAGEVVGRSARVVLPSDEAFEDLRMETRSRLARSAPVALERALCRRDGSLVWCRLMARVIDRQDVDQGMVWIAEDITEQRAAEAALALARDEAQAANRAKSAFLANTSHELRTPLNGLLGLARLALRNGPADPRHGHYLQQMHDSAQTLAAIISDILDFSRIEAGKLTLECVAFQPAEIAESVLRLNEEAATEKGIVLQRVVDPMLAPWMLGDAVRVRQILSNYVANAVKFTDSGRVCVRLGPLDDEGNGLRLQVEDTGPGITAAVQARLFHPFTQADESTTRRFGGTGLGLSICRELAAAMGGRVGVDSAPGAGSCFWAELPLPAAAPDSLPDAPPRPQAVEPLPSGRRVLVVEDHPVNMLVTVAMLEQQGLQVLQARDGREALDAVQAAHERGEPVQLVLMDVHMPVMGGHEAARRLRLRWTSEQLPIVALTAAALVGEREAALASGMDDFLTKPIDPSQLQSALLRLLA